MAVWGTNCEYFQTERHGQEQNAGIFPHWKLIPQGEDLGKSKLRVDMLVFFQLFLNQAPSQETPFLFTSW